MKTNLFLSAFCLVVFFSACQKETLLVPENTANMPSAERCGCLPPVVFKMQNVTDVSAKISWNTMPEATGYQLEFVESAFANEEGGVSGFIETTGDNQLTINGLKPGTAYKFTVTSLCGLVKSDLSVVTQFETKTSARKQLPSQKRRSQPSTL